MYYRVNSVNYDEYLEYNCTQTCQLAQYCSIIRQRYEEFEECFNVGTNDAQATLPVIEQILSAASIALKSVFKEDV